MKTALALFFMVLLIGAFTSCAKTLPTPEERAATIGSQLRCPVCRGASINDSPSALAQEMMVEVRQQIADGKSDQEILGYFEARYGTWVLLEPKAEGMNLLIWILPAAFLVGGGGLILLKLRQRERS
jgi:cytochrome c-type biogenesis protein CcmH